MGQTEEGVPESRAVFEALRDAALRDDDGNLLLLTSLGVGVLDDRDLGACVALFDDIDADGLSLNEIGRVTLRTTEPLFFDPYRANRHTGSFILIDESTNATVAAGMASSALMRRTRLSVMSVQCVIFGRMSVRGNSFCARSTAVRYMSMATSPLAWQFTWMPARCTFSIHAFSSSCVSVTLPL